MAKLASTLHMPYLRWNEHFFVRCSSAGIFLRVDPERFEKKRQEDFGCKQEQTRTNKKYNFLCTDWANCLKDLKGISVFKCKKSWKEGKILWVNSKFLGYILAFILNAIHCRFTNYIGKVFILSKLQPPTPANPAGNSRKLIAETKIPPFSFLL